MLESASIQRDVVVPRPALTTTLCNAIELGDKVINRTRRLFFGDEIAALAREFASARRRMVEGGNPMDCREVRLFIVEVLPGIDQARLNLDRVREATWIKIATELKPYLEAALYDAIQIEARRPSA